MRFFLCMQGGDSHYIAHCAQEEIHMPKTKTQGIIFGLIMSYAMAYGMEVYNIAIKMGFNLSAGGFSNMTDIVF